MYLLNSNYKLLINTKLFLIKTIIKHFTPNNINTQGVVAKELLL